MLENVDDRDDVRVGGEALLLGLGDKRPELVDVDDRAPVRVAGEVEVAHTDLTEVTGMVLVEVGTIRSVSLLGDITGGWEMRTGGGADHRRDRDRRGACDA